MKRILSLILVLCILLSFAACGKDKEEGSTTNELTAYELIDSAIKKTQALDSLDMKMIMSMKMTVEGESVEMPVEYYIKAVDIHSKNPRMSMVMNTEIIGMSVDMDFYLEDGYYYVSTMGKNMKMKAEAGDGYDVLGQSNNLMVDLDQKYLKDTKIITNNDGSKTVKLEMDRDAFKNEFKDLLDSTGEDTAELLGITEEDISISNAVVEITVDQDGYVDTYDVKFDMNIVMDGEGSSNSISVELVAGIDYNNPGQPVTVTAPEGYKNYPEVDPDTLS